MDTDVREFNLRQYDRAWRAFQAAAATPSNEPLGCGVRLLYAQGRDQGWLEQASDPEVYRLAKAGGIPPNFLAQLNRRRCLRQAGAGRTNPPPGMLRDPADFLDRERIRWASCGAQLGLEIQSAIAGRILFVWAQPFPLAPLHCTVAAASAEAEPQTWVDHDGNDRIHVVVADLIHLARSLGPNWFSVFNGSGAGATQPRYHCQIFLRPNDRGPYPLEYATRAARTGGARRGTMLIVDTYPITALCFEGRCEPVLHDATKWLRHWLLCSDGKGSRTANLIVTSRQAECDDAEPVLSLWVIPRHKLFRFAAGLSGQLASLEMLGEIVLSSEDDERLLRSGGLSYEMVERALAAVEPPGIREFLRQSP